ncbi:methyltransferase domain-containing protein [Cyanobium sp. T1B-Tous]|uniref:methyltransferase domain-containing protein n=1 Tax=Cyanobium sp. T1B-Tous TaxID=2823721 RepID=UPI0020CB6B48|nr:methyltransferase domain-containing protein [Cyanobium sp. T1B-Tous]MCP9807268.1 methyltransferase domain-containing protein [Cyanobium sp. T1B-Tous]
MKPAAEESYVVGTSEAELARLLRQHALFRPACMEAWRRAGVGPGLRVLDVGAGPGAAALDLAALVGPAGSVVAVERNSRFVSHGQTRARASGLAQLEVLQADLLRDPLPAGPFDLIWCRWVAVYLEDGARLVERLVPLLGQGGRMLFLETIDWSTLALHGSGAGTAAVAGFGRGVDRAIAASGGDPVLARRLPGLLAAAGLQLEVLEPLVLGGDAAVTEWLADVIALMGPELVRQGIWPEQDLTAARAALQRAQNQPGSYAVGPLQLWIQARRP